MRNAPLACVALATLFLASCHGSSQVGDVSSSLHLQSRAFGQYSSIPVDYTCDGKNVSPPLTVSGVPEGTQSLVLMLEDPDAANGSFTHWLLWNIPPATTEILTGTAPAGAVIGGNDTGDTGYSGPCPPAGSQHHYVFTLYAIDAPLYAPPGSTKSDVKKAMQGHVIGTTTFATMYRRAGQ